MLRQADEADPTQPAPGVAQLDTLIAGAVQAGLATSLSVTGPVRPLPPAVDLAAYRIIQESLINAIRHAGPATAAVSLSYDDAALRIDVAAPVTATQNRDEAFVAGSAIAEGPGALQAGADSSNPPTASTNPKPRSIR